MKRYDIKAVTTGEESLPKFTAKEVSSAIRAILNVDVRLVPKMTIPDHLRTDKGIHQTRTGGAGWNIQISERAQKAIFNKLDMLSVRKDEDGYIGESTGSANVTSNVVKYDMAPKEAIRLMAENGTLREAAEVLENERQNGDPPVMVLLTYALWHYAMGWKAEKVLQQDDRYWKTSTSGDQGGQDAGDRETGGYQQLKSAAQVTSAGRKQLMGNDVPHMVHLWGCDGTMWVTEVENFNQMTDDFAEEYGFDKGGVTARGDKTLAIQCEDLAGNEAERPFRYTWFEPDAAEN